MKAIIGKKLGMTRIFNEAGEMIPVTLIEAQPSTVSQVRTVEKDGYSAVQLAMPEDKKIKKPQQGHLAKVNVISRTLKEFPIENAEEFKETDQFKLDQFQPKDRVTVTGISKGKGFAGTVKRHNFATGPKTHGSNNYRQPGSIGAQQPQRVIKGRRMAGHMGHEQITIKDVEVINVDSKNNVLMLKGAIPGANRGTLYIWSK
jgi:large subunit ribosomal protein L3